MIIRSKRGQSRLRSDEHRHFQARMDDLQQQNKCLRMELLQMQQRYRQSQAAKKKYKAKYREAKQKLEILAMIGRYNRPCNNGPYQLCMSPPYQLCMSPKLKTTRIRTISEEEFQSLRAGLISEFHSQGETKGEQGETHSSKRCVTAASTMKEIESESKPDDSVRILQHLLQLQQQLEAISQRIQSRNEGETRVVQLQGQIFERMQEVVQKMSRMEKRDIEREARRVEHQRQKSTRRFNSSMKAVERIGRDLLGFKVDQ